MLQLFYIEAHKKMHLINCELKHNYKDWLSELSWKVPCLTRSWRSLLIRSSPSNRWWRTGCVGWWPRCHSWTSRDARICFAALMRSPTGCTRMRRGNSRSRHWKRPSPSCRRSWGTTGTASKSSSCRWGFDLADLSQISAAILSTALSTLVFMETLWMLWQCDFLLVMYQNSLFSSFGK